MCDENYISEERKMSNKYCSVPQCSSKQQDNVSFHLFPKNGKLKKEWSRVLRIGKRVTKYMYVCSLHFAKNDYFLPNAPSKCRRLKRIAVPSLKLPQRKFDKVLSVEQLEAKRKREERVNRRKSVITSNMSSPETEQNGENIPPVNIDNVSVNSANASAEGLAFSTEIDVLLAASMLTEIEASAEGNEKNIVMDKAIQVNDTLTSHKRFFLYDLIRNDKELTAFTGICSRRLFIGICESAVELEKFYPSNFLLSLRDRIFLTMIKLKLNLSFTCLAVLFQISSQTCKNYFHVTLLLLVEIFKPIISWPEKETVIKNMPSCFQHFQNVRVVLDCMEVAVEKNKCINCRLKTYSHYKGTTTIKFMIGIAPSGLITFISDAYGGRTSDKEIFNQSGLIKKLLPTVDAIMVDKGFLIEKECLEHYVQLVRPPFLSRNSVLSKSEAVRSADIARARVHVERTIQRIKVFKIFNNRISYNLLPFMDSIMTVIAGIVNLSKPVLAEDKF